MQLVEFGHRTRKLTSSMDIFVTFLIISGLIAVAVALSRSKNSLRTASSLESQIAALREELRHITKRVYQLKKTREASSDDRTKDEGAAEETARSEAVQAMPAPIPANAPRSASFLPRVPAAPAKESSSTQPSIQSPSFTAYSQRAVLKSSAGNLPLTPAKEPANEHRRRKQVRG